MILSCFLRCKKNAAGPFLFGTVLFLVLLVSCKKTKVADSYKPESSDTVQYFYYGDFDMWNHIYGATEDFIIPDSVPVSMFIPHHDITVGRQNSFYKAVSKKIKPSLIVVVSPDHFEKGKKLITVPDKIVFETPQGDMIVNDDLISRLKTDEKIGQYVSVQDDVWSGEHGIFVHTPFLKKYFPDAEFVPVLVKPLSTENEFQIFSELGTLLSKLLPDDSFLIASVDCSHYQIPSVTAFHDEVTINTILNYEDARFAEIDSPESIEVLYSYNKGRNALNPVLIDHSSTYDYIPDDMVVCTSHLYMTFYKDLSSSAKDDFYERIKATKQRTRKNEDCIKQTVLITGSGKTGAGIRRTWKWDRYKKSKDNAEILLRNTAGTEARFLYGFDALIFDPPADTVYEQKVHDTVLRVQTITQKDFAENYFISEDNFTQKKAVNILEVILQDSRIIPDISSIRTFFKYFDVIVFRDDDGLVDAVMYCKASKNDMDDIRKVELGICHGKGKIKGKTALLNFYDDRIDLLTLDYQSKNGVIPAIYQFDVE